MTAQLESQLKDLPTDPGIYQYFDAAGELIYVGKAVNLRNRVRSYFVDKQLSPKTRMLVSQIDHLKTIVVQSEMDALILEANLIKEHKPRYNIILKDDKSHLYIRITLYEDLPRVSTCRATDVSLDPKATYFGPYPSSGTVKRTLRYLRRVFTYIARHQPLPQGKRRPPQSYFYYNLPLGQVDPVIDKKRYRAEIFQLIHFLEGKRQSVADELEKEMRAAAKELNFERAAEVKHQLDGLNYVSQIQITPETYLSNPELMAEKRAEGIEQLGQVLSQYFPDLAESRKREAERVVNRHPGAGGDRISSTAVNRDSIASLQNDLEPPRANEGITLHRVECYDISNISGQQAVGSMVVFEDGEAKKSDYRKFRIKMENKPNDFAMMQEVLTRRFARLKPQTSSTTFPDEAMTDRKPQTANRKPDSSFESVPDLIVIDGGKGQLTSAMTILQSMGVNIPIVGMTKREEELVIARLQGSQGARMQAEGDRVSNKEVGADFIASTRNEVQEGLPAQGRAPKPNRSSAHAAFARSEAENRTQIMAEANFTTIRLPRGSESLFFLQRLRDEAHRFAITYHRKLRGKAFLGPA